LLCAALGIAVAGEAPPPAAPPAPDAQTGWTKSSRQYLRALEDARVHVDNPHGSVFARFGGYEHQLEVLATSQRIDDDLPQLEVFFDPGEAGLEVRVAAAEGDTTPAPNAGKRQRRDRIDLVVFVPQGIALDVTTLDGGVEVKGIKSDLTVSTRGGEIRVRKVDGHVSAKSVRGSISVALENGVTSKAQELATETGDIEAYLWEDAAMRVELDTSGRISTDFSLEIEHRRYEEPDKHATAVVGNDGPRLKLWSRRGALSLLRLPREEPR
jgi:hypothetical protein